MAISGDLAPSSPTLADGEVPAGPHVSGSLPEPATQNEQANGFSNADGINRKHIKAVPLENAGKYAIPLHNQFAYKPRRLKFFTIGPGLSGLLMAQKF